jgi:hypothetical protein
LIVSGGCSGHAWLITGRQERNVDPKQAHVFRLRLIAKNAAHRRDAPHVQGIAATIWYADFYVRMRTVGGTAVPDELLFTDPISHRDRDTAHMPDNDMRAVIHLDLELPGLGGAFNDLVLEERIPARDDNCSLNSLACSANVCTQHTAVDR